MQFFRVGDRYTDESGEWEVIGQLYTTGGGRGVHATHPKDRPARQLGDTELGR